MSKWETLEHNGPVFPKEYEYIGFDPKLSSLAEEMLYHYSAKLETEYVSNPTFNKNFWNALKSELPKEYQSKKLEDFLPLCKEIFQHIQNKKEERKSKTKEQKLEEAKEKDEIKEKYGWAILNGEKQPIASPYIEGPGIFITRGDHPQLGAWKYRVQPEDISINATNVVQPPIGHKWKVCKENKNTFFTCLYKIQLSTGNSVNKFIQFSAASCVKQNSDQKKFEKAIKLISKWNEVKSHIEKGILSENCKTKQTALVCWLIMNLGIRVGDEKREDSSDTVGASSLRKEHVSIENNFLKLDFLGKDSVRYVNRVEMSDSIKIEFEKIINNTDRKQQLFPKVSSVDVKEFLNEVVDGISAKVFRTAWGSSLLAESLKNSKIKSNMTQTEKITVFNEANLLVAKKLNHQKNVGKNVESKIKEMKDFYAQLKDNYKVIEKDLNSKIANLKLKIKSVDGKNYNTEQKSLLKKSYKRKISNYQERLDKNKKKVSDYKIKMDLASKTKNVALGTSKTNYCDPRIGISFCKSFDIQLEKVYNKAMQDKFSWALDCESDYYFNYKTIGEITR